MINGVRLNHWFFWSLLAVTLLVCGLAYGQVGFDATAPKMVGTISGVGFVPLYDADEYATADLGGPLPWLVQVDATTNMEYTFWAYGFGADGTDWQKISPRYGVTAADTSLTLDAGESEVYMFASSIRPSGMYVTSGTGKIRGE